jgi:hypothetical protein
MASVAMPLNTLDEDPPASRCVAATSLAESSRLGIGYLSLRACSLEQALLQSMRIGDPTAAGFRWSTR